MAAMLAAAVAMCAVGSLHAQVVQPVSGWLATVDSASQQIVLRWHPSQSAATHGYHICTGMPCLDYDTLYGRFDTSYVCTDHRPTEQHTYRVHVFDTAGNVSALTPSFGPMVLDADVPECATTVSAAWTPYIGMPGGVARYVLMARLEPFSEAYEEFYSTDSLGTLAYDFDMAEGVTSVSLVVMAYGAEGGLVSRSNEVSVVRRTADRPAFIAIDSLWADSVRSEVHLHFALDSAFGWGNYTLWRSVDGRPWTTVATFAARGPQYLYTDSGLNPNRDSLHCYQLSVLDACGMNPQYSATRCAVLPPPPEPLLWAPNAVTAGADDPNGLFLPVVRGLDPAVYLLSIYDRNGQLVYATADPTAGWRPGTDVRQGVYVYRLRLRFATGNINNRVGTVLVIK